MKLHNTPNILIASNIDNFSRYDGDSFGISASASYSNPDAPTNSEITNNKSDTYTTNAYNPDSSGVGKSIGYGSDSDSQTSTTYSGINTSNITITGNGNTDTPVEAGTGIQTDDNGMKTITAANLADIFTSTTTDTIKENSGSLANTFDAEAVQNELDVQTRVTQTFDTNRQEVKAEINSVIDEANEILKEDPNNKEAQQTVEDMQRLGVPVDSISGALYSPADNALGTVANTLSPAIVYEIGQYFKENEELNKLDNGDRPGEGSAQHILAQTLVAAATASLAGNDELTAGLSAGGAEVIAPILADWMYDKETKDLTSEEKNTISAIISLGSAAVGATTGETTDVISSSVAGSVVFEDNAGARGTPTSAIQNLRTTLYNNLLNEYTKITGRVYPSVNAMPPPGEEYKPSEEEYRRLEKEIFELKLKNNNYSNIPTVTTILNSQLNQNINETMVTIINGGRGTTFRNNENNLPSKDVNGNPITYREYKVIPILNGRDNNVHRMVVGSDGNYYYTNTHYGQNYNAGLGIPFYRAGTLPQNVTNTIFGGQ